jgi:hypothetical protein
MKLVCVTAICGGYDKIIDVHPRSDDVQYICFTDNPDLKSDLWEIRPAFNGFAGRWDANIRNAKHHKVMIHAWVDCEISLWLDSNITLFKPPTQLVEQYLQDCDICTFTHWGRQCIYQEADTCSQLGLDDPEIIRKQMEKYRIEGYPEMNGLNAGGFILRRHTKEVAEFNRFWWDQINQYSKRDQLSLNYCIWKTGIKMGTFCPYPGNDFMGIRVHGT